MEQCNVYTALNNVKALQKTEQINAMQCNSVQTGQNQLKMTWDETEITLKHFTGTLWLGGSCTLYSTEVLQTKNTSQKCRI